MSITLEDIKFEHSKLAAMIAVFEQQPAPYLPEGVTLAAGERFICSITRPDGKIVHTILLQGDADGASWGDQMKWAKSIGGELPSRAMQAQLYDLMPEEFKEAAYWSNTQHSGNSYYAWYQNFTNGDQHYGGKDGQLRARAVRQIISNSVI
ncbi:MAG: hypothetical protein Q7U37_03105 [Gallionella sp.]|nr:hypothetical protein [Gallionella sp.]